MEFRGIRYQAIKRRVKYPRLEFKTGELMLILPPDTEPEEILEKHYNWVSKKIAFIKECLEDAKDKKIIERSDKEFRRTVESLVEDFSKSLRVRVNKVYFRRMRTKWASCSSKRNITVNTLVRYLPLHLVEYIIFHELTHLLEKRHNKNFWKIIASKFNSYLPLEKELFSYWFKIWKERF